MIRDCQHCQSFVVDFLAVFLPRLRKGGLEKLVLEEDDRQHHVLQCVLMPIQLTEDCTQVEMSIGQGLRLIDLQLQLQRLDQIGQSSAYLACPAVVTGEVIKSGGFELQRVPGNQLRLPEMVETQLKLLLLELDHGS